MKKSLALLLGIIIALNLTLTGADELPEESKNINLYIINEGGHHPNDPSNLSGNISTKAPNTTTHGSQILNVNNSRPETYTWYSDPLKAEIFIDGDVHFTFWVTCSSPRYLSFWTRLFISKFPGGGGGGHGVMSESKLVSDEPVEFNSIIPENHLDSEEKNFHIGDRIGIGIGAEYSRSQPPANVTILYNSTNYPSRMTIKAKSMYVDISNSTISGKKASVDVIITDAFGIYDIVDYDIQITAPSNKNISHLEIIEEKKSIEGKLKLIVFWNKSDEKSGKYDVSTSIIDNNNNQWEQNDTIEFLFLENGDKNISSSFDLLFLLMEIFIIFLIFYFILRIRKKLE